jgi:hypothetical protein
MYPVRRTACLLRGWQRLRQRWDPSRLSRTPHNTGLGSWSPIQVSSTPNRGPCIQNSNRSIPDPDG